MKNRSKRKSMRLKKKPVHPAPANHSAFDMLIRSQNESKDEEMLVRMLREPLK